MADDTIQSRLQALREGRVAVADLPSTSRAPREIAGARVHGHGGHEGRVERTRATRGMPAAVSAWEASSAPFEHLVYLEKLYSRGDKSLGEVRARAGFMFRDDVEMSQISSLSAKPISDSGGGGGKRLSTRDQPVIFGRVSHHHLPQQKFAYRSSHSITLICTKFVPDAACDRVQAATPNGGESIMAMRTSS